MAIDRYHFDNDGNMEANSDEKIKELEAKMEEEKINNQLLIAELFEMMTGGTLDT